MKEQPKSKIEKSRLRFLVSKDKFLKTEVKSKDGKTQIEPVQEIKAKSLSMIISSTNGSAFSGLCIFCTYPETEITASSINTN